MKVNTVSKHIVFTLIAILLMVAAPGQALAPMLPPVPFQPRPVPDHLPSMTEPDPAVELLARLIYAEARGEDYEGQVAVGAVVMNRVRDKRWPGTVHQVIYQRRQFTPASRGLPAEPGTMARRAARAALAGQDPTGGAIFFYNPRMARDEWIFTRPVMTTIGNHRFAR